MRDFVWAGVGYIIEIVVRAIIYVYLWFATRFDFNLFIYSLHSLPSPFPTLSLICSCLSWNTYIKTQIASADYDGVITLWDALIGQPVSVFEEHEKRAWSVDFCNMDPTKLISGSDDTKGKRSLYPRQTKQCLEQ